MGEPIKGDEVVVVIVDFVGETSSNIDVSHMADEETVAPAR
jgi:hypothetical protein